MSANDNDEAAAAIFDLARNRSLDRQVSHPGRDRPKLPKRFYKTAEAGPHEDGYAVLLDGRPVKTPSKRILAVPSLALAEAMAAEWDAQREEIDPRTMWLTKLANTAIDLVAPRRAEVIAELVNYSGTDLLCYRTAHPAALVARQAALWDPLLGWAAERGISLVPTVGILHVEQPSASLDAYRAAADALDAFHIAALHNAVTLTGSAVVGLAMALGRVTPEEAFNTAYLDEHWQMELSGEDEEERARLEFRRSELAETGRFIQLLG
ncbi:MAG: ATPase [Alphaproteobacteria bacterium]|nr:ATPase [Alphaproteobacteria bacterium]MDX5416955.1 ATPase [Alphaproteobacteria bacterium]MDX5494356.1 ATPase [Alphaproteobacteria bacterium]